MANVIESSAGGSFDFRLEGDDEVYSIPLASSLPLAFVRMAMAGDAADFPLALLDKFCPEFAQRDDVTIGTVRAVFEAWSAASTADGIDMGKR